MKKLLLGFSLVLGLAFGTTAASAAPPPGHGGGPACADIVAMNGAFYDQTEDTSAAVAPNVVLADDSCRGVTYTVYVLDETGTELLAQQAVRGNGEPTIEFDTMAVEKGTTAVCVYATSSAGNHVFDRAPANGCVVVHRGDNRHDFGWWP